MFIKKEKLDRIFKESQVILAYLFGSEARGASHKESDVDIGILFDKKVNPESHLESEGKLIAFFSEIYPKREINIVNFNVASPLLKQVAILEGRTLYQKSDLGRILFQIQTLHEYEDYLHY